ncbi:hypothetical protein EDC01DRAFT_673072 [Geopyxis carbonaria]|nr:hypothetical protein EDC01DRAFT_673072 [Geopyxis carbonaria]
MPIVVILGAAFAGIPIAHKLLRTLPAEYQVVLVNPSTHLYWNIAAPRAVAKASAFGPDNAKVFAPIVGGFSAHAEARFRFIQGKATSVVPATNTCEVALVSDDAPDGTGASETLEYAHLVVATGSSAVDGWPFKSVGPHTATAAALSSMAAKIAAADTIVLSGAGATGVETTGEIATFYPDKKVILVSASEHLLPITRADIGDTAQKTLSQLGVQVITGTKVVHETPSAESGKLELALANGTTLTADLHIPTYGLVANTGFMPRDMLDEHGWVHITPHCRTPRHDNIWAAGDVATVSTRQSLQAGAMAPIVAHNIQAAVDGVKEGWKEYKEGALMLVVPIGGKFAKGTGHLFGWRVWGLVVWAAKGRDFMVGNAAALAAGKSMPGGGKV